MIPITKEEKEILSELFPKCRFPRTMRQDSKRHHYFCVESENLMRAISGSNLYAAEIVKTLDRERKLKAMRQKHGLDI